MTIFTKYYQRQKVAESNNLPCPRRRNKYLLYAKLSYFSSGFGTNYGVVYFKTDDIQQLKGSIVLYFSFAEERSGFVVLQRRLEENEQKIVFFQVSNSNRPASCLPEPLRYFTLPTCPDLFLHERLHDYFLQFLVKQTIQETMICFIFKTSEGHCFYFYSGYVDLCLIRLSIFLPPLVHFLVFSLIGSYCGQSIFSYLQAYI